MATIDLTTGGALGTSHYEHGKKFNFEQTFDFSVAANLAATSDVIQLFDIPAGTIIDKVTLIPVTVEGSTCTATVGDGDDVDGWLKEGVNLNTLTTPQYITGHIMTTSGSALAQHEDAYHPGKYYASADTIDLIPANSLGTAVIKVIVEGTKLRGS